MDTDPFFWIDPDPLFILLSVPYRDHAHLCIHEYR